ncbi:hypothetical protein [Bradyrhizobium sp. JYMT SZCCT0180]|uniref:hypothetical protein n=1 Tax=Bradyrhizobium sp. JYMT SZCCT0180 TaxID=2807666 RepID=UPI001BAE2F28|nr:hypothetical protein [Bradyrhizobium sp. JYMT SZCCT0180]MBR1215264.1 hypothetical protein [Bradyrhizobium sp. JYMT SZCCT0180]
MKRSPKPESESQKQPPENPFDRIFKTVLLRSESEGAFEVFRNAIYVELGPRTPIEHLVARQIANAFWQVERLQPLEAGIMNNATVPALQSLIEPTSNLMGIDTNELTNKFFSDDQSHREVQKRLTQLGMSESDIKAESFRLRAEELQALNRLQASAQSTAIKLLRIWDERRSRSQAQQKRRSITSGRVAISTKTEPSIIREKGESIG